MNTWQLQDAKARLSELVRLATKAGPQGITVRGKEGVVVLSVAEYNRLLGSKPSFLELMEQSPLKGIELSITRDKSLPRDVDL